VTDDQIDQLAKMTLRRNSNVHWMDSLHGVPRLVLRVQRDYLDPDDAKFGDTTREPVAWLESGMYIALYNVQPREFVRVKTVPAFRGVQ
jgi:hypothetical protein